MPVSYDIMDYFVVLNSGVVTKVVTKDICATESVSFGVRLFVFEVSAASCALIGPKDLSPIFYPPARV